MKETIEYLKKDRKVNDTFMKKLQKVGFEIDYTRCGYWNNVECVRIGRSCIPLYETHFSDNGNSESLDYRYQNDVIKDIYNTEYSAYFKRNRQMVNRASKRTD